MHFKGHEEIVWAVEAHGSRLFSASADKTIRVWDIESRRCEQVLEDHSRPVLSLAIANNKLFSGSYDYTIKVWSLDTLTKIKTLEGHTDAVRALAIAGQRLFSGSYDSTVRVWDIDTMESVRVLSLPLLPLNLLLGIKRTFGPGPNVSLCGRHDVLRFLRQKSPCVEC